MTTRPFTRMHSAEDVRTTADRLGSHFFDEATMKWFNSRLTDAFTAVAPLRDETVGTGEEIAYIVTSEKFEDDPRQYGVRRVRVWRDEDGRDHIDFDRVLVTQLTHARQSEALGRAKTLAQLLAATEREQGITGVNEFLAAAGEAFASIIDITEVH